MDDIDFLKANSHRHAYQMYVDSAKRNRAVYAQPNYYKIEFNTPLKNVFSIQVLDASIPRTHYNVDVHTNRLYFIFEDDTSKEQEHYIDLDIGDYDYVQLVGHVNIKLSAFHETLSEEFKTRWNKGFITMDFLSSPAEVRKQFLFKAPFPFAICTCKSSIRETMGFDDGSYKAIRSVDDSVFYNKTYPIDSLSNDTTAVNIQSIDTIFYQRFVASENGNIKSIEFDIANNSSDMFKMTAKVYTWNDMGIQVEVARANAPFQVDRPTTLVSFSDMHQSQPLVYAKEYFVCVNVCSFISGGDLNYSIYTHAINNANSFYITTHTSEFSPANKKDYAASLYVIPNNVNGDTLAKAFYGLQTTADAISQLSLEMNMRITQISPRWSLTPPGVYNLTGDRYIILRCPEVENHVLSSVKSYNAFNTNTNVNEEKQYYSGIAKFKMGVVGYREERFDFNTLPPFEFHPIGKLASLTFAFENPDGRLYDFRGVNHTITIVVNYYQPVVSFNSRNELKSHLYPHYKPDQMVYNTNNDLYDVDN